MFNLPFVPRATALAAATFVLSLSASAPALAGPAVVSSPPYPAAGCTSGTLSSYQGTGSQGCTVGALTFFNFTSAYEYVDGAQTALDPAPLIDVAPGAGSSLTFSSTLFDRTLQTADADYYFEYYIDPPIDIVGFHLRDAPFLNAYVEASVCVGATFNQSLTGGEGVPQSFTGAEGTPVLTGAFPQDSCRTAPAQIDAARIQSSAVQAAAPGPQYYYLNIDDGTPDDAAVFTQPDLFADVILHVHVGGLGHIDSFSTGADVAVPEPATWALTALGGLALAGTLRRKRRRAPGAAA